MLKERDLREVVGILRARKKRGFTVDRWTVLDILAKRERLFGTRVTPQVVEQVEKELKKVKPKG